MFHSLFLLGQGGEVPSLCGGPNVMLFAIIFAIFYFIVLRPERKRQKDLQDMLGAINKNDKVVTQGGIIGVVTNVKDDELVLRVDDANKVKIRVRRAYVVDVLSDVDDADKGKKGKKDKKG